MSEIETPDFNLLLGPVVQKLPVACQPAFLAALERGAAERYREWARAEPELAAPLLACAEREEEIAKRAEALFPVDEAGRSGIEAALPEARRSYQEVFEGHALPDQWRLQAAAERTGAEAWRAFAAQQDDDAVVQTLLACAGLEEESARQLDALVAGSG